MILLSEIKSEIIELTEKGNAGKKDNGEKFTPREKNKSLTG